MAEDETGTTPEETKVTKEEIEARLQGKEPEKKDDLRDGDTTRKGAEPAPGVDPATLAAEDAIERAAQAENDAEIEKIIAQADKPDAVRNALNAERNSAKEARERAEAAETRVKEYEDRDKTEEQKREEKAEGDRKRADAAEAKLQRVEVAIAAKLPLELAERLQGSTKKELETDAARLLELVKPNAPTGDPDAGKGEAKSDEEDFTATLRKKAGIGA